MSDIDKAIVKTHLQAIVDREKSSDFRFDESKNLGNTSHAQVIHRVSTAIADTPFLSLRSTRSIQDDGARPSFARPKDHVRFSAGSRISLRPTERAALSALDNPAGHNRKEELLSAGSDEGAERAATHYRILRSCVYRPALCA